MTHLGTANHHFTPRATKIDPLHHADFAKGLAVFYDNLSEGDRRGVVLSALPFLSNMRSHLDHLGRKKLQELRPDQQYHILATLAFGALTTFTGV